MHTILFKLETALFFSLLVLQTTVLNNIIPIITQSRLSVAQASSSIKCLHTCTPIHATLIFITEVLHLFTYKQLF